MAVTAESEKAQQFGIPESHIFPLWEWVGGRYSIWSTIGLPLALSIGMKHFLEFLSGAHAIDQHVRQTPLLQNAPVLLGLLSLWYTNFFSASVHAIIPYAHTLHYLPRYLQQAEMESHGKMVTHAGDITEYPTGPILFGEQGCNGQHAYHQWLHQGQHFIPADFILVGQETHTLDPIHHDLLIASGLSQMQALLQGKTWEEAHAELIVQGYSPEEASKLASHKQMPGNRPSNTIFIKKITPYNLGALLALYEHKIFTEGVLWNINSFDQWGVELGKTLLGPLLNYLQHPRDHYPLDSSTSGLIRHYHQQKETS